MESNQNNFAASIAAGERSSYLSAHAHSAIMCDTRCFDSVGFCDMMISGGSSVLDCRVAVSNIPCSGENAGGGDRTHTILRSLDFESSASASSATPARRDQATKEKRKLKPQ